MWWLVVKKQGKGDNAAFMAFIKVLLEFRVQQEKHSCRYWLTSSLLNGQGKEE